MGIYQHNAFTRTKTCGGECYRFEMNIGLNKRRAWCINIYGCVTYGFTTQSWGICDLAASKDVLKFADITVMLRSISAINVTIYV